MRTRLRMVPSALVRAAWITVWPSGSAWRSQTPSWEKESRLEPALPKSSSTTWPRLIEAATKGLTTATKTDAEPERRHHRHRDQPQRRDAGGAHHHELARAREAQEGDEARQHQHQREHLVEHLRRLQQRDVQDVAGAGPAVAEAAQVLDRGEEHDDERDHGEDPERPSAGSRAGCSGRASCRHAPGARRGRLSRTSSTAR